MATSAALIGSNKLGERIVFTTIDAEIDCKTVHSFAKNRVYRNPRVYAYKNIVV